MRNKPYRKFWQLLLAFSLLSAVPAGASERLSIILAGGPTRTPPGWVQFCADRPSECGSVGDEARNIALTDAKFQQLADITTSVNRRIKPMTDLKHHGVIEKWDYAEDGYGDCEDYVLVKRRALIQAGWPSSTLLMTIVRTRQGNSHMVLTVRTSKGEFILDNLNSQVRLWSATGYQFLKRQSVGNPNVWVSLGKGSTTTVAAAQ